MAWRVRPVGRPPNEIITGVHSSVSDRVERQTADARCITLLAFNGFAVQFSRSAILFIGAFFGDDLAFYQNSSICCSSNVIVVVFCYKSFQK